MSDVIPFDEARTRKKAENLLYNAIRYLADGPGQEHLRPEDREDFQKAAWRLRTGRDLTQAQARAAWRRLKKYEEVLATAGIPFERIPEPPWPTEAIRLIEIVEDGAILFHDPARVAYAVLPQDGHLECHAVRSRDFKLWLSSRFRAEVGKTPANQALTDALADVEATCIFSRPEQQVFVRLAEYNGRIYLDLGNAAWEAVEITPAGWRIVANPPVNFRRPRGMAALPRPEPGGSIDELRRFVNVADDDNWRLLVAWLVAALRPRGPYPVLVLTAEQGAGKTTVVRVLRALVDPATAPVRTTPRDERDLMIAATNAWVLAFDNLSTIPAWLSDALCRIATGGGFATRALYSDSDEVIFDATRPLAVNGIEDVVSRHDLLDRSLLLNLPPIPDERRRPEEEFWREFEEARPRILGALLDAVAEGLRNVDHVKLDKLPRMADFARWVVACEPALPWEPGGFEEAHGGNRASAVDFALESDLVANAVRDLLTERESWTGSATDLLKELEQYTTEQQRKSRAWPKTPKGLSGRVQRAATFLRTVGVDVRFVSVRAHKRIIELRQSTQTTPPTPPTPPNTPEAQLKPNIASGGIDGGIGGIEDSTPPLTPPNPGPEKASSGADLSGCGGIGGIGGINRNVYLPTSDDDPGELF